MFQINLNSKNSDHGCPYPHQDPNIKPQSGSFDFIKKPINLSYLLDKAVWSYLLLSEIHPRV